MHSSPLAQQGAVHGEAKKSGLRESVEGKRARLWPTLGSRSIRMVCCQGHRFRV